MSPTLGHGYRTVLAMYAKAPVDGAPTLRRVRIRQDLTAMGFVCSLIDWGWSHFRPDSLIFDWAVECPREFG